MRFILTGATGAIGMALISNLFENQHEVTVLVNPRSSRNKQFKIFPGIEIIECDQINYHDLSLEKKYDVFIHMAWEGGKSRANIDLNLSSLKSSVEAVSLSARLGCKVFLSTGTQAEYGSKSIFLDETTLCEPENVFAASKLASMHMTSSKCLELGLRHIWLRICSVYGPYDGEQTMIMRTIRGILNKNIYKISKGDHFWDFIHADDVANAIDLLIKDDSLNGLFLIGEGSGLRLKDYMIKIFDHFNRKYDEFLIDDKENLPALRNLKVNPKKLMMKTGWRPKINFEEGSKRLIEYCKENL